MKIKQQVNFKDIKKQRRRMLCIFVLFCTVVFIVEDISGGVAVAPSVVVLSDKDQSNRLTLMNTSQSTQEVKIELLPPSASLIWFGDDCINSADEWIQVFPQSLILEPGGSSPIRLNARPPDGISDGEHLARVIVQSRGTDSDLAKVSQTETILKYRSGELVSLVELTSVDIERKESSLNVSVNIENRGNVSYPGIVNCKLIDDDSIVVAYKQINIVVYNEVTRHINLPLSETKSDSLYRVVVTVESDRRTGIGTTASIDSSRASYTMLLK